MTNPTDSWAGPDLEDEPIRPSNTAIERAALDGVQPYETASTALAAAAKATVEARFVLALRRPRDIEDVRVRLLKDCRRPKFADAARYSKPVGKKKNPETGQWEQNFVEGPSARFAEASLRHLGNIDVEALDIFDDERQRIIRVVATDLETNATTGGSVVVTKTIERHNLKRNQRPLRTRANSYGETVYIVEATDDEVANKVASAVSKMRRNLILLSWSGDFAVLLGAKERKDSATIELRRAVIHRECLPSCRPLEPLMSGSACAITV